MPIRAGSLCSHGPEWISAWQDAFASADVSTAHYRELSDILDFPSHTQRQVGAFRVKKALKTFGAERTSFEECKPDASTETEEDEAAEIEYDKDKPIPHDTTPNATVRLACARDKKSLAICDDVYCGGAGCVYPYKKKTQDGLEEIEVDGKKKKVCPTTTPNGEDAQEEPGGEEEAVKKEKVGAVSEEAAAAHFAPRVIYFKHKGYMRKGGELPDSGNMSVTQGKQLCTAQQECRGFSYKKSDAQLHMYSKWDLLDLGNDWSSYRKVNLVLDKNLPLSFDGKTALPLPKQVAIPGDFQRTVGMWVKTTSPDVQYLFSSGKPGSKGSSFNLRLVGGYFSFTGYHNDINPGEGQKRINDGTWHFLVASYDGAMMRMYVDGYPEVIKPIILNTQGHKNLLGATNDVGGGQHFTGSMKRFFVAESALDTEEVKSLYGKGADGPFARPRMVLDWTELELKNKDEYGGPIMQKTEAWTTPTLESPAEGGMSWSSFDYSTLAASIFLTSHTQSPWTPSCSNGKRRCQAGGQGSFL